MRRKYKNILVDSLVYTYVNNNRSNQLLRVTDSGTGSVEVDDYPGSSVDYMYDGNGNMTFDGSKSINIGYNRVLNLPVDLDYGNNNRIFFHYDATGRKVIKHVVKSGSPDEVIHNNGNIVYEGGQVSYILTEEGRLVADYSGQQRVFLYEYTLKDHLGNARVVFMGNDPALPVNIVQSASYYPFGLVMKKSDYGASTYPKNRYLYNGKEINCDRMYSESLNWYDYGARFYDPQLGRFTVHDAYAEKYFSMTPYQYGANNPILFIDVNGDSINVANQYREQFYNDLKNVFGDKASSLTFNENGNLLLSGTIKEFRKGLSKDQKATFKGLKQAMDSETTTSVVYENNYNLTIDGATKSFDIVSKFGGGVYSKTDNVIVIAPNVGAVTVQIEPTRDANGYIITIGGSAVVDQNTTSTLFHEIGERNTPSRILQRGVVIDYENYVRRILGMPHRPYDIPDHPKTTQVNIVK